MAECTWLKNFAMKWRLYVGVICYFLTWLYTSHALAHTDLSAWPEKFKQTTFSGVVHVATSDDILLQHHQGLAERARQRPFNENTVFDIGSLTKQFVAIAILRLVEQGKLDTNATLAQYFPLVPADKKHITIHQLLTHSSGLPTNLANHQLYDKVEADEFARLAWHEKLVAKPAEKYNYSNIGYGLLAHIIEKVSGQPWELFIQQHILLPSGLKNTGYRLVQAPVEALAQNYGADANWLQRTLGLQAQSRSIGDPLLHLRQDPGARWFEGAGGFVSTVSDMQQWFLTLHAKRILTAASWQTMFTPYIVENANNQSYYGYGVAVDQRYGVQRISHTGSNGYSYATMDYFPELDLFMFTASNDIDHYPHDMIKALREAAIDMRKASR